MHKDAGLGWGGRRHKDGVGKRMVRPRKRGALPFFTNIAAWKSKEVLNDGLFQVTVTENADGFPKNVNPTVLGLGRRNTLHLPCFQQNQSSAHRENQSRLQSRLQTEAAPALSTLGKWGLLVMQAGLHLPQKTNDV